MKSVITIKPVGDVYHACDGSSAVGIGRTAREALAAFHRIVTELRILRATMA